MEWLEISLRVIPEAAEAVAEVLSRYAPQGVAFDLGAEQGRGPLTVRAYLAVDEEIEARRRQVEEALWHLHYIWEAIPAPEFSVIADRDWTAGWKETIPILHLGRRVVIRPSWKPYMPVGDELVLELDPGMAFGTGLHPTTQLCVEALEETVQPGMRVLDIGTGTGILAFLAAKMGAAEVVAVDNDMSAVTAARRNASANHVAHTVRLVFGSLPDVGGIYDVVFANILAPVIIDMAQNGLASRVRPGGLVVASGILIEQENEVIRALEEVGLGLAQRRAKEGWSVLLARRVNTFAVGYPRGEQG